MAGTILSPPNTAGSGLAAVGPPTDAPPAAPAVTAAPRYLTVPGSVDPCGTEYVNCMGGGIPGIGACIALASCRAQQTLITAVETAIEYIAVISLVALGLYLVFSESK